MNERIKELVEQATSLYQTMDGEWEEDFDKEKFAELILANADELKREVSTDPINKPFELNPKFVAKCDEIGRSRRQFQ
jgi:hypothetical protein